jgi:hypothetical protein
MKTPLFANTIIVVTLLAIGFVEFIPAIQAKMNEPEPIILVERESQGLVLTKAQLDAYHNSVVSVSPTVANTASKKALKHINCEKAAWYPPYSMNSGEVEQWTGVCKRN